MIGYIVNLLLIILFVSALAVGSLWGLKRLQATLGVARGSDPVQRLDLVAALPLGPQAKLAMIAFGDQHILLAVSRSGVAVVGSHAIPSARLAVEPTP